MSDHPESMPTAAEALARLRAGNRRFVAGQLEGGQLINGQRDGLVAAQRPFAIILGCSDSRVPAELVFDQGLGDLFVIRVAGNIVDTSQLGSVEFAAAKFGTPLVVVLGHSNCGAIQATLAALQDEEPAPTPALQAIVASVAPAVTPVLHDCCAGDDLLQAATRANVQGSVARLQQESELLRARLAAGQLTIVGAEYDLASGEVRFLEERSEPVTP